VTTTSADVVLGEAQGLRGAVAGARPPYKRAQKLVKLLRMSSYELRCPATGDCQRRHSSGQLERHRPAHPPALMCGGPSERFVFTRAIHTKSEGQELA